MRYNLPGNHEGSSHIIHLQLLVATILANINQHRHPTRQMPNNMTVEQPHPRIIRPEPQNRITPTGNIHRIPKHRTREIIPGLGLQPRRNRIHKRIIRAPADRRLINPKDIEVVAVLRRFISIIRNKGEDVEEEKTTHQMERMSPLI